MELIEHLPQEQIRHEDDFWQQCVLELLDESNDRPFILKSHVDHVERDGLATVLHFQRIYYQYTNRRFNGSYYIVRGPDRIPISEGEHAFPEMLAGDDLAFTLRLQLR